MGNHDKSLEPACFYLRKSREDREAELQGSGETLSKHKKVLLKLAGEHGVKIDKIFQEIVSGESIAQRPEMKKLLAEVTAKKWASVWCVDIDRLGRGKMQDQGLIIDTFKETGTKIVTLRKIYDLNDELDEEYTEFETFMARKELKLITRRLQRGRLRSVLEGNYLGAKPPYGYLIRKNKNNRILMPHPQQAKNVKLIFKLYTELKMGTGKIAEHLNILGEKTYTGKAWSAPLVLQILKNEVYLGKIQWRKKETKKDVLKKETRQRPKEEWLEVKGKHEPLVSEDTFKKTQDILKRYHSPVRKNKELKNSLAGLIFCEICQKPLTYRPYPKQKPHLICTTPNCPNKSSRFEYIENTVVEALRKWLGNYKIRLKGNTCSDKKKELAEIKAKELTKLRNLIKQTKEQKEHLCELLEKKIYDEKLYNTRLTILAKKEEKLEQEFVQTESELKELKRQLQEQKSFILEEQPILSYYEQCPDISLKNKILKTLLHSVTYKKEKDQKLDEFKLVIYPKLPKEPQTAT